MLTTTAPYASPHSLAGLRADARAETSWNSAKSWCAMAVGSLVLAGLLSLAVVVGRLPVLSGLIGDPLFFKRCLVVHVDLALVVWFYAFVAGLLALGTGNSARSGVVAFGVASAGVVSILAGALAKGAQPVLANYVPVIDHPLFLGGLGLFFAGVVGFFIQALLTKRGRDCRTVPGESVVGLQASAVAVVLALVTAVAAYAGLPAGVDSWTKHEFTAWGAGHVLQVANVAAMLAVWLWLVRRATGTHVISARVARVLFTLLLAPHFVMPLLTVRGTLDSLYHTGATLLMRWTIFPVAVVVLVLCVRHLWMHRRTAHSFQDKCASLAAAGFAASAGLTVLGMILGACIRTSTTLVPAHYHASLGGVTASFMAAAYLVAQQVSLGSVRESLFRAARSQLVLFGVGQAVFALGFAIGGAYGLGRKAYGAEQHVRSAGEYAGLIVMGLGGLVATAGGLWFLFLILREMCGWWRRSRLVPSNQLNPTIA